jgi:predicted nuclease of predicted toxin-antitoxin system
LPEQIRLIADENISWSIKNLLKEWNILPANQILANQRISDFAIWQFAKSNNYQILTFDEDFTAIQTLYGFPPKIVWLRTGNLSTTEIASKLLNLEREIKAFLLDAEAGVFEITSYS